MNERFALVGIRPQAPSEPPRAEKWYRGKPVLAAAVLGAIVLGCLLSGIAAPGEAGYMDLENCGVGPCRAFPFGTDTMGRDIFTMIWHGGRVSLSIGLASAALSTAIAILFGTASGCAPRWLDALMMRLAEIFLSVPSLLAVVLLQAILGEASVLTISLAIGVTSWTSMAKIVRAEVRRLRSSEYVIAAKCMGGGFFHILWRHLTPNFVSSIMFMAVMNIRSAIAAESTLSFMGIGLPLEVVSWGSMLSLSEKALLTRAWWIILIPGAFLVVTLLCVTSLGDYLRKNVNRKESNL